MTPTMQKFNSLVDRLVSKIELSQTPVPGFLVGLSGTDSIITFLLCYKALQRKGMENRLCGIYYTKNDSMEHWFVNEFLIPGGWLRDKCPKANFAAKTPLGGCTEHYRWADMHTKAIAENYWIAGTMNATEKELGTYSNISKSASLLPIQSLWKSEILELCEEFGVPNKAICDARIPDCLCGRAEIAAENIEIVDDILRYRLDPTKHDPELVMKVYQFINNEKKQNGFKSRIPYIL